MFLFNFRLRFYSRCLIMQSVSPVSGIAARQGRSGRIAAAGALLFAGVVLVAVVVSESQSRAWAHLHLLSEFQLVSYLFVVLRLELSAASRLRMVCARVRPMTSGHLPCPPV